MSYQFTSFRCGPHGNAEDIKLTKFVLEQDERGYYLSAKYRVEDEHAIREIDIPKIRLHLNNEQIRIDYKHDPYSLASSALIDLGFGMLPLDYVTDDNANVFVFKEQIIEEKYTDMTLEEIEKKLGYKVKIVNKRG
jgi:hypothetical protein